MLVLSAASVSAIEPLDPVPEEDAGIEPEEVLEQPDTRCAVHLGHEERHCGDGAIGEITQSFDDCGVVEIRKAVIADRSWCRHRAGRCM